MSSLSKDLAFGVKTLRGSPGLVTLAVLSLALGVGAAVAVFSIVDVFLIRPLPYDEADRLLHVYSAVPERGWMYSVQSLPDFLDVREQSRTMDVANLRGYAYNLSGHERPERIEGERVSWNYFNVLRVSPALGRSFSPEEERAGRNRVAILSDALWHRRFGADPDVIGRKIRLDAVPHTVIGVLPPGAWFDFPTPHIWTPLGLTGEEERGSHFTTSVARLVPGATVEQAHAEATEIGRRLAATYPESNEGWEIGVRPFRDQVFSDEFRTGSLIGVVAVAFVLLITCANLANLMLTRVAGRSRELALRAAVGAGRGRIVRQLLTEAMVLSILGGVLGVFVSVAGIRGTVSMMPEWFPRVDEIGLDARALLFAVVVTVATGILFGLAPALQSARRDLAGCLREGARGHVGSVGDRLRRGLVVAEISLALALLVSTALLVKGFVRLQGADYGWNEDRVLSFDLSLPEREYDEPAVRSFYRELLPALESLPGVRSVGGTTILPMRGNSNTYYRLPGHEYRGLGQLPVVETRFVFPGYFGTMEIPLLRGRLLTAEDRPDTRPVIVISELLAERHWPGGDPIGQHIEYWDETREIVGVAQTTLDNNLQPFAMAYMSALQYAPRTMSLVVRTASEPTAVSGAIRDEIFRLDPNLPMFRVKAMKEVVREQLLAQTIVAKIMGWLAAMTLVLAVAGVYGVMAYSVEQRTREMGIRMALGARRGDVLGLVFRQGSLLALLGLASGILLALLVTRGLSIFLYGVEPGDVPVFGLVSAALLFAALAATFFPARRATRVNPVDALRAE